MRKLSACCALTIFFMFLIPSLVAADSASQDLPRGVSIERIVKLRPLPGTEVLIPDFEAMILADGSITVSGSGRERVGGPTRVIEYEVDLVSETYRTHEVDARELQEATNPVLPGDSTVRVGVQTRYFVFFGFDKLTETSAELDWTTFSNGTVLLTDRTGSCWAADPSKDLGTHWLTKSCNIGRFWYLSESTVVCHEHQADYYNYDYGNKKRRTNVSEYVRICGRNDGYFDYRWKHRDSGEGSFLFFGWLVLN
jgi:hypothetical protein